MIELRFKNGPETTQHEVIRESDICSFFIVLPHRTELAIKYMCNGREMKVREHFGCMEDCYARYLQLMDWLSVKQTKGIRFLAEDQEEDREEDSKWANDEEYEEVKKSVEEIYRRYILKPDETDQWDTAVMANIHDLRQEIKFIQEKNQQLELRLKDMRTDPGPEGDVVE